MKFNPSTIHAITRASKRCYSTTIPTSPSKKIGAFKGGFLGFLTGVAVTSVLIYTYALDEYKKDSSLVLSDVLSLQKSIRVLEEHVKALEQRATK